MTSKRVKDIITEQLKGENDLSCVHGLNLYDCLIEPIKETYTSSVDSSIKFEFWAVFKEMPNMSDYRIIFEETEGFFGQGMVGDIGELFDRIFPQIA